jgi:dTDP-4-amino-4,6-dideoxygalactose transaminase
MPSPPAAAPVRQVPLLDLKALHQPLRTEILAALERVFDSQSFILGDDVRQLEREIAAYCGAQHAVGCASGTDALILALEACGVGRGDGVLTTPFSFFATASAIHRVGATPVFADIDPATFNLDPTAAVEAARRHPAIKAVIPVHLYGGAADMDPLLALAQREGWSVIEDAAQAIGAEDRGRRVGSLGRFGCFSFFPTKNLGGLGDGGMVTALEDADARSLRAWRVHGSKRKYYHQTVGYNSRLDSLQAAALSVKLRHLDTETAGRQRNAARYSALLAATPVATPEPAAHQSRHVFNQYAIRAPRRDELKDYLSSQGIGTEIYYPLPLHLQECFSALGYAPGDFPASEEAARQVLALPIHSALTDEDLEYVAASIARFY